MWFRYTNLPRAFVLLILFSWALFLSSTPLRATPLIKDFEADVIVYRTQWCPICKKAEAYLQENNVMYELRDIEQKPIFRQEFTNLGGQGVPLILVGDVNRIMSGWDEAKFNKYYQAFEKEMAELEEKERAQEEQTSVALMEEEVEEGVESSDEVALKEQTEQKPPVASKANDNSSWVLGTELWGKKSGIIVYRTSDSSAQKLVQLRKNDIVVSTGKNENGMLRVTTTNGLGWVDPKLLEEVEYED